FLILFNLWNLWLKSCSVSGSGKGLEVGVAPGGDVPGLEAVHHGAPAVAAFVAVHAQRGGDGVGDAVQVVGVHQQRAVELARGAAGSGEATNSFATRFMPSRSGVTSPTLAIR